MTLTSIDKRASEGDMHQESLRSGRSEHGQILVIAAVAMTVLIALGALLLEAGNAYAQQRVVQNGADAAANAGAVTLAQRLGGMTRTDADVFAAVSSVATANRMTSFSAHYTNVSGQAIDSAGNSTNDPASYVIVGAGTIPPGAQGVALGGTRSFETYLGRAIGFNSFDASADATAVTGRLVGGDQFLPIVLPVNIVDCDTNGSLGSVPSDMWSVSQPGSPPNGIEYIVPLCKTGGGSFQILDLDPDLKCDDEVAAPPYVQWDVLPVMVPSDPGNNCAKPIADYVSENLVGETVLIPICDNQVGDPCGTEGGSHAEYRITKVAAFYIDYLSDTNNKNNPECQNHVGPTGQQLVTIAGNGSSSCIVGWFVKFISSGPVGSGTVSNTDAIGVQLIQ